MPSGSIEFSNPPSAPFENLRGEWSGPGSLLVILAQALHNATWNKAVSSAAFSPSHVELLRQGFIFEARASIADKNATVW